MKESDNSGGMNAQLSRETCFRTLNSNHWESSLFKEPKQVAKFDHTIGKSAFQRVHPRSYRVPEETPSETETITCSQKLDYIFNCNSVNFEAFK